MHVILLPAALLFALLAPPLLAQQAPPAEFAGLLSSHNSARQAVGVAPLAWSGELAAEAQAWADQLAGENCALRYDPDPERRKSTGQNLYRAYASTPYSGYKRSAAEASERWISEGQHYDHSRHQCKPGLGSQCGAYLQVIWETSTTLGCGRARCPTAEVWACHYTPRGGQEGLKPYGNPAQQSAAPEPAPVQQCGWQGPTPADRLSDELERRLLRQ